MLSSETLKRIRQIEFHTRKLVDDAFVGEYHAVFKGRGMEFDSVRPYQPGDDVRLIDWNVSARMPEPYVKQYVEERELTVMLVLDASASCFFGTVSAQKHDTAAELGAVLAYAAIRNHDKVGLVVFSDQLEHYVPPRTGRNHTLRLIRDLVTMRPAKDRGTDLALALRKVNRLLKNRAIIFLMSDFLISSTDYLKELMLTAQHHDVIGVVLSDDREQRWPDVGIIGLEDAETGETQWVDTSQAKWREQFQQRAQQFQQVRNHVLNRAHVDQIVIPTNGDYMSALGAFFQQRARRRI